MKWILFLPILNQSEKKRLIKVNTKENVKMAKILFRSYGVNHRFTNYKSSSGYYCTTTKKIVISLVNNNTDDKFWSTVFHELVHHLCYTNDIWKKYHNSISKKYLKKVAFKA
jgi:Zn-dependent peptidase ImmA (M78 family)